MLNETNNYVRGSLNVEKPALQSICELGDATQLLRTEEVQHLAEAVVLLSKSGKGILEN